MALNPVAGIDGDDLLFDRPGEDRTGGGQHLISEDRCGDAPDGEPHMGAIDGLGLELSPPRQQIAAHELVGLLPRLIAALGVVLAVALGELGKGAGIALRPLLRLRVFTLGDRILMSRASSRASLSPMALPAPRWNQRVRPRTL